MVVGGVKFGPPGKGKRRRPGRWARLLVKVVRGAQAFGRQVKDEIRATGKGKGGGGLGGGSGQGGPRTVSTQGRGRSRAGWEPSPRSPFDLEEMRMQAELFGARQDGGRWVDAGGRPIVDLQAWVSAQEAFERGERPGQDAPAWQGYGDNPDDSQDDNDGDDVGDQGDDVQGDASGMDGGEAA